MFLTDFVEIINKLKLGAIGEFAIRRVFRKLDKNKNGELDSAEVGAAVDIVKGLVAKMLKSNGDAT